VPVKPGFALGSYAAFKQVGDRAMVMGDLVLLDQEVPAVMSGLFSGGLDVTAVHNHLNEMSPHVMYMHYEGHGDAVQLAKALRQALSASGTPLGGPGGPPAAFEGPALDTKQVEQALGRPGRDIGGGIYQVTVPRGEPQIQLVYQTLSLSNARDEAATVRFDRAESLAGRIGGRLARTWLLGASIDPRPLTAWFRVNFWHEFLGDSRTKISSALGFVPLPSDLGGTWAQMTAGVSAQVSRMVSLYAAANHQIGFDNARHAYDGKLGVRVNW
jgi:Domain of Unknown Function (DUF1259)/Autotransporter beta-domain